MSSDLFITGNLSVALKFTEHCIDHAVHIAHYALTPLLADYGRVVTAVSIPTSSNLPVAEPHNRLNDHRPGKNLLPSRA